MKVRVRETDERLGVVAGEVYQAQRYTYDPHEKITLLSREPDGYNPCCNQYKHEVDYWIDDQWMRLDGNKFVSLGDTDHD